MYEGEIDYLVGSHNYTRWVIVVVSHEQRNSNVGESNIWIDELTSNTLYVERTKEFEWDTIENETQKLCHAISTLIFNVENVSLVE